MAVFSHILKILAMDIHALDWLRELFLEFDDMGKPLMGIKDWDDAACFEFGGKVLVASCDGPYKKRLVMKSALIHAATDVIVKGAKPLFCLDTLTGIEEEVKEMAKSLGVQGKEMNIPILGGNTMIEDVEPKASLFVVGELLLKEPIRDRGGKRDDELMVLGEPIWGGQEERFKKAKNLFNCWYKILESAEINASKDITKGGLLLTVREIAEKSGLGYELVGHPFHPYRNLDNFLIAVDLKNSKKIWEICKRMKCPVVRIGRLV
jgi:selenophosphate synthetase-related protein